MLLLKLLFPSRSRHTRYVKSQLARFRASRFIKHQNNVYNRSRQDYYSHRVVPATPKDIGKVSIVVPCFNTPPKYLEPLLASVFNQSYANWELVIINASTAADSADYIEGRSFADARIHHFKTTNDGIALNTNKGIEKATGKYIAFLDHDDTLDPDALLHTMHAFESGPYSLVYSDEDKISDDGDRYFEPHYKPDFSIDMLRNVNYITHFVVATHALVKKLGGIKSGFDGAQDYDFLLRAADSNIHIAHVPKILYHWRQADGSTAADFSNKPQITQAGCKALTDHFARNSIENAKPYAIKNRPGFYGTHYTLEARKRAIHIDFTGLNLTQYEQDFIYKSFAENESVIKNKIHVALDTPQADTIMQIRGTFIPQDTLSDLADLFGLAEEAGVYAVAPKITHKGRVYDMGIVYVGDQQIRLFKGLDPTRQMGFGSVEWVRNVDELSDLVSVRNTHVKADTVARRIIWSHIEFMALESVPNQALQIVNSGFYNPNLETHTQIVGHEYDYIEDLVRVKQ